MLGTLRSTDFAEYLNEKFKISAESVESVETELINVTELGPEAGPEAGGRRPFSIVFRGPEETYLAQGIYKVEHEKMGTLDLFLVPIGPDKVGMLFEVLFN